MLVGRPGSDPTWEPMHIAAADKLEEARGRCKLSPKDTLHRRGRFPALASGISFGGGQLKPKNRSNGENTAVLAELTSHPSFVRLAGFASGKPLCPFTDSFTDPTIPSRLRYVGAQAA